MLPELLSAHVRSHGDAVGGECALEFIPHAPRPVSRGLVLEADVVGDVHGVGEAGDVEADGDRDRPLLVVRPKVLVRGRGDEEGGGGGGGGG